MTLGISTTKSAVIVAPTRGAGGKFVIAALRLLPFQVRTGNDLTELQQRLLALFDHPGKPCRAGHCLVAMFLGPVWFVSGRDQSRGDG
ncbi:MAG: hypothetical protein V9H26_07500 [Verrucomicrobiota bacterium]